MPGCAVLAALSCASCGASNEKTCSFPEAAPLGAFDVRERNEFSAAYRVLSVTYSLDGCELESKRAPGIVGKETVVVQPSKASAGAHKLGFAIKLRDVFGVYSRTNEWIVTGSVAVNVPQGGSSSITLRMFDDPRAEPRARVRVPVFVSSRKSPFAEAVVGDARKSRVDDLR